MRRRFTPVAAALAHTTKPKELETMNKDDAAARKAALMADRSWVSRYLAKETAAVNEMATLNRAIAGIPVATPVVGRSASAIRDELLSDPSWVAKYMAGDVDCRSELATINRKIAEALPDYEDED